MSNWSGYRRSMFQTVVERMVEPPGRIQVIAGPRQAGKTTLAQQVLEAIDLPGHYASADDPALRDRGWLEAQWEIGRRRAAEDRVGAVLVLDEIQKVGEWSEIVKRLRDEDARARRRLRVMILGSAPLLMARGLSETLAGRFEVIRVPHWSYAEMRDAFGFDLDRYVYFGGYPGAAGLTGEHARWASYILDSIIETTVSRDVLLLTRVDKPALLRSLFRLACEYSAQIVSYQKLTGSLQDAGNTTTLAHYLDLLGAAGMVCGLERFSGSKVSRRRSTPKLLALNTALVSALDGRTLAESRGDGEHWGRLVETAVGAHLRNHADARTEVMYWRERGHEVDFVLQRGPRTTAIEVKAGASGRKRGLDAFSALAPGSRKLLVGADGIPVEEFLSTDPSAWIDDE
jgi:predicted AAA+ superfamily ATPase